MLTLEEKADDLNSVSINIVQRGHPSGRYLLFIRCSSELPLCLLDYEPQDDLTVVLSVYRKPNFSIPSNFWIVEGGLSKFHAAKLLLNEEPALNRCEYSAFFDNDVAIPFSNLMRLFHFGQSAKADLYQGAVSLDSNTFWIFLKQQSPPSFWRETSFVEVMAPYFSRSALSRCLETFDLSISTWGLDFVWYARCKNLKMGVTDTVVMRHDSSVDVIGGPFYQYLKRIGIDAAEEGNRLRQNCAGRFYIPCEIPSTVPSSLKRIYVMIRSFKQKVKSQIRSICRRSRPPFAT